MKINLDANKPKLTFSSLKAISFVYVGNLMVMISNMYLDYDLRLWTDTVTHK